MSLFDLTAIMSMVNGDEKFIEEFIQTFLKRIPTALEEMNEAWDAKRGEDTYLLAHKLKSSIDLVRINSLKDDIRYIEKHAQDTNKFQEVDEKIKIVNEVLHQVFQEMKEEI